MFATARYLSGAAVFAAKRKALVGAASFVLAAGASAVASAADFTVSYSGSGTYVTRYHSEPPNQSGMHDTDTADDSESQHWSMRFLSPLRAPCAVRCAQTTVLTGARGATSLTAQISHVHLDGLYSQLNASVQCSISASTPAGAILNASLRIREGTRSISITALDPLDDALLLLPTECPGQGDSIDGLLDNYLGPGFSFAPGYGPDRWFTSTNVIVPLRRLRGGATVRIPLSQAREDTPPRDCAVPQPSIQQCVTGGAWSGVLTLRPER